MSETPRIAISIVNYRTAAATIACIESVVADLAGAADAEADADRVAIAGEVVVVDNASGDGSAEAVAEWCEAHPDAPVRLVRSADNTGFSGGHNQAFAASTAPFVLLLNSDAELRPGCLAALLAAAEAAPAAGLVAPQLEDADGTVQTSCFRFPTAASELIRGANSGPLTAALRRWDISLPPPPEPGRIQWASFACILLRREMIAAIGPMDEGYFLYFEDIEYALRAHRAGWGIVHAPRARALHHRGGSGPVKSLAKARARLPKYYYASRTRYHYQKGGMVGLLAADLAWVLGRGLAHARVLFGKPVARAAAHEARDIWTNVLRPLGPRHAPHDG